MRFLLVFLCAGAVWAQAPLHLEVTTPSTPGVRFDAQGRGIQSEVARPVELAPVQGSALPAQSIRRDLPWWASPEIPSGPGRAWPTSWPGGWGGPGNSGPGLPGGGWGAFGPVW